MRDDADHVGVAHRHDLEYLRDAADVGHPVLFSAFLLRFVKIEISVRTEGLSRRRRRPLLEQSITEFEEAETHGPCA
jgi:hypothetical protein